MKMYFSSRSQGLLGSDSILCSPLFSTVQGESVCRERSSPSGCYRRWNRRSPRLETRKVTSRLPPPKRPALFPLTRSSENLALQPKAELEGLCASASKNNNNNTSEETVQQQIFSRSCECAGNKGRFTLSLFFFVREKGHSIESSSHNRKDK